MVENSPLWLHDWTECLTLETVPQSQDLLVALIVVKKKILLSRVTARVATSLLLIVVKLALIAIP